MRGSNAVVMVRGESDPDQRLLALFGNRPSLDFLGLVYRDKKT